MTQDTHFDCAIVGAGPGGLTAAIYLSRFHRNIVLLDAGESRARWIPESHNCPGFPHGVSGDDFLDRLRSQAAAYEVKITPARIDTLEKTGEGFCLGDTEGRAWNARNLILATGVIDILPDVPWIAEAVGIGAMRLCAICDGYEVSDGRIGVYGAAPVALSHALFLRTFSAQVAVICAAGSSLGNEELSSAESASIEVISGGHPLTFTGTHCEVLDAEMRRHQFDAIYPVLGSDAQSGLAQRLGANVDANSELIIGPDQQTLVPGLYAVGDVVSALNQISVAVGHAAIAATAIHNSLPANHR